MFYYRLYSLDPADGHFSDVLHFISENDASAIEEAKSLSKGVSRELWNRDRKVMDFVPAVSADDGPNRLARLINPGQRWRWNPLAGHCQLAASDGHRSALGRAAANDSDPLPHPHHAESLHAGEAPCTRHFT